MGRKKVRRSAGPPASKVFTLPDVSLRRYVIELTRMQKKSAQKPQPDEDEPQPTTELGTLMHDDSAHEEPGDVSAPGEASSDDSRSVTQSVVGEDMMDVAHGAPDGKKHVRFDLTATEGVEIEDELDRDAEPEIEPDEERQR